MGCECGRPCPVPHDCHLWPHRDTCGIFAYKTSDLLLKAVDYEGGTCWGKALGVVYLAGRVIEHDRGYRAEQAEILCLMLIGGQWVQEIPFGAIERTLNDPAKEAYGRIDRRGGAPYPAMITAVKAWLDHWADTFRRNPPSTLPGLF